MATGDDAAAGDMDLVAGSVLSNTIDTEITKTRDYIANGPDHWKPGVTLPASLISGGAVPIGNGGTGQTTAPAARTALGITAPNVPSGIGLGSTVQADLDYLSAVANSALSTASTANSNANGRVSKSGDTMSGNLFLPASSAATSGWTVAYINADGRVCRGSSSEKYKKFIHDAPALGNLFAAPLREYQMRVDGILPDDHKKHIGYIAEELVGTDLERFVVIINDQVESIDFIAMLMAQVAQLNDRVTSLEAPQG